MLRTTLEMVSIIIIDTSVRILIFCFYLQKNAAFCGAYGYIPFGSYPSCLGPQGFPDQKTQQQSNG